MVLPSQVVLYLDNYISLELKFNLLGQWSISPLSIFYYYYYDFTSNTCPATVPLEGNEDANSTENIQDLLPDGRDDNTLPGYDTVTAFFK